MHGIVFDELQKYVERNGGPAAWTKLLSEAGLTGKFYLPLNQYPDEQAVALVAAAAQLTGKTASQILEDFGEFMAADLILTYKAFVRPEWKTLDLIECTEDAIHRIIRLNDPAAHPPYLKVQRLRANQVQIRYTSQRKMCALAVGIARGLAKHYNERIEIRHIRCMLDGAQECEIEVTKL
jgi:predicted hydrocarbon binding protein